MHVIAVKRAILAANPWIARNLYNAFDEFKRRSLERLLDPGGVALSAAVAADLCAQDARPVRRRSLPVRHRGEPADAGTFLPTRHQQGIAHRHAKPEEIFPAGIMAPVKV